MRYRRLVHERDKRHDRNTLLTFVVTPGSGTTARLCKSLVNLLAVTSWTELCQCRKDIRRSSSMLSSSANEVNMEAR